MTDDSEKRHPGAMNQIGLLLLRIVAGSSMIIHYSWAMVYTGWKHFWSGRDWPMIAAAEQLQLPQPTVWAVAVAIILFFGSVFLILGLLGRVTSGLMLAVTVGLLYAAMSRPEFASYVEICVLYSGIFLALVASGHGVLSCDRLLAMRPRRRRPDGLQDLA